MITVAALYVERGGVYWDLPDVDPWDEARDARKYAGPWPVVAHPPCARWCMLASLVESLHPNKRKGEDEGCFESALNAVRTYGGVLEHPAYSEAFYRYSLPIPQSGGGWQAGFCGGWSACMEQVRYGHRATKRTWLYAYGFDPAPMRWGYGMRGTARITWLRRGNDKRPILEDDGTSAATPPEFRDVLLSMARSVSM